MAGGWPVVPGGLEGAGPVRASSQQFGNAYQTQFVGGQTKCGRAMQRPEAPAWPAFLRQFVKLDPAVLRATFRRRIRRDVPRGSIAARLHPQRTHAFACEVGTHRPRARHREPQVRVTPSDGVGVACDLDANLGIRDQRSRDLIQYSIGRSRQNRATGLEIHAAENQGRARRRRTGRGGRNGVLLKQEQTPELIHARSLRRVGAAILRIGDPIAIGVLFDRTAIPVYLRSRRRIRALVQVVRDAVVIAVQRTAECIDRRAGDGVRALVDAVGNAVVITVHRAPVRVDHGAGGRVRTLIQPVPDAVMVGVDWASGRIDLRARGGVGALVDAVVDAVAVGIGGGGWAALLIYLDARRRVGALFDSVQDAVTILGVRAPLRIHAPPGPRGGAPLDA